MASLANDLKYQTHLRSLERRYLLPSGLLSKVAAQESGFRADAESPKGARGVFQIMPGTAKELGVNPDDPYQAADGAARYLSRNLQEFKTIPLALAAYNAGPGNVRKYGGVPPFKETRNYVSKITGKKLATERLKGAENRTLEAFPAKALEAITSAPEAAFGRYEQLSGGLMELFGRAPTELAAIGRGLSAAPPDVQQALMPGPPPAVQQAFDPFTTEGMKLKAKGAQRIKDVTPANMNRVEKALHSGLSSAFLSAPALVAGVAGGPVLAASAMGMQALGSSFADNEKLADYSLRLKHAARDAVLEAVTEVPAMGALMRPTGLLPKLKEFLIREIPGENISEVGQAFNAAVSGLTPGLTAEQVVDTVIDTTLATVVAGGVQTAAMTGTQKAVRSVADWLDQPSDIKEFTSPESIFENKPEKVIREGEVGLFGPVGRATEAAVDKLGAFLARRSEKFAPPMEVREAAAPATQSAVLPAEVQEAIQASAVQQAVLESETAPARAPVIVPPDPDTMAVMNATGYTVDEADSVFGVNITKMNTTDDVKQVMAAIADQYRDRIDAQRDGVRNWHQVEDLARLNGQDPKKMHELLTRTKGRAYTDSEIRSVKKLQLETAVHAWKAGQKAHQTKATADLVAAAQMQARLVLVQETLAGARAEAGRALGILRRPVTAERSDDPDFIRDLEEMMQDAGGRDLLEAGAELTSKATDPAEIVRGTVLSRGAKTARELYGVWINMLLSGPFTHARNVGSNTLVALWHPIETAGAATLGSIKSPALKLVGKKDIDRVYLREVPAAVFGTLDGIRGGIWMAAHTAVTGDSYFERSKIDPGTEAERSPGGLYGLATRWPTRLLAAEDEFFKGVAFRQRMLELGVRDGIKQRKRGIELGRHAEAFSKKPSKEALRDAMESAHVQTFTNRLGDIGQKWMDARNATPGLSVVIPFLRTPTNIVKFAVNRTPLGVFTFARDPDARRNYVAVKEAIKQGGAARDEALSRVAIGTSVMAYFAALTAAGLITGGGPSDPERRQLWRQTHQPYSGLVAGGDPSKLGDWVAYDWIEPAGMVVGMAADFAELSGGMHNTEAKDLVAGMSFAIFHKILSKTMMQGLNDILNVMNDSGRYAGPFFSRLAGSVVPTAVATKARGIDPTMRDTSSSGLDDGYLAHYFRETVNGIKNRLPNYSQELPPRRDIWGAPIIFQPGWAPEWTKPFGTAFSPAWKKPAGQDPVAEVLYRAKWQPPRIGDKVEGVEITSHQRSELIRMGGGAAEKILYHVFEKGAPHVFGKGKIKAAVPVQPGFANLNDDQIRQIADDAFDDAYDAAKAELVKMYPDLERKMALREAEKLRGTLRLLGVGDARK